MDMERLEPILTQAEKEILVATATAENFEEIARRCGLTK
jgi:DNA-binding CsgD family transcriptional regulator